MIYFAQTPTGSIKIGCSDDVETRLGQLANHYGAGLSLLATMQGGRKREAEIHERFAHLRLGRTEQFRPAQELLDFIGKPLLVSANPDAVEAALRLVRLQLPPAEHKEFRKLAAEEETNMALLARRVILDYIARKRKEMSK